MPVKWKIFFALNFVVALPAFVCLIVLTIDILKEYDRSQDYTIAVLFLFGLLMITLNSFLNIYMIQRFFPDKLLPVPVKRFYILSLVINSLVAIGILVLCIYGASIEFSHDSYENERRDATGKIALAIIFSLWLVQVVILVMQGRLPAVISRNNHQKIHSLIDSIGQ